MFGLKIIFWIIALLLVLMFVVALLNSTEKDRKPNERYADLVVGVVLFTLFIVLFKVFGGYVF